MNFALLIIGRWALRAAVCASIAVIMTSAEAQTKSYERSFPQSKTEVERAIANMQSALSGHLPVLDGFADAGGHPFDHYRRGFFQAEVQVNSTTDGGSVVQVSVKVTAWYNDPAGAHSGYQLLASNGRIESDVLDQLGEQLAAAPAKTADRVAVSAPLSNPAVPRATPAVNPAATPSTVSPATTAAAAPRAAEPPAHERSNEPRASANETAISAPTPQFPATDTTPSSSLSQGLASSPEHSGDKNVEKSNSALRAEVESLEEVLKNQAHPKNLVAVKKSGTPVVSSPSLTAKPNFFASQHDEFELLNFSADWVQVRISGLSRGWIWRNSVEMPEGIADTDSAPATTMKPVADLFHVTREEIAQFPGDWEPLRSKDVKILTVQRTDDAAADTAAKAGPNDTPNNESIKRLDYTRFLLEKTYAEISDKPQGLAGIVVIFDSTDGGIIAATMASLQEWKAGRLSDSALWHKCFFDPPDLLDSAMSARGQ